MRPIDQLVSILKSMVYSAKLTLDDFEDFADKFSMEETCSMLAQIAADARDGLYLSSSNLDKAIKASGKLRQQERAIANQSQVYH